MGFEEFNSGKTSGSRVRFIHENYSDIVLRKPLPNPELSETKAQLSIRQIQSQGRWHGLSDDERWREELHRVRPLLPYVVEHIDDLFFDIISALTSTCEHWGCMMHNFYD